MLTARQNAVEVLHGQTEAQIKWLGADRFNARWQLPVMDGLFRVDADSGEVCWEAGGEVRQTWQILTLHYLAVRTRPTVHLPGVTFASLPSARVYASVYENRVNRRLCASVAKDVAALQAAAADIASRVVDGGDFAFEINIFPRIRVRLVWYAGDQELAPSCTLLLPTNIESFLCTEDIVVMSELFVSRLGHKPF